MNYTDSMKNLLEQIQKSVLQKSQVNKQQNNKKTDTKKNESLFNNNSNNNINNNVNNKTEKDNDSIFDEYVDFTNTKNNKNNKSNNIEDLLKDLQNSLNKQTTTNNTQNKTNTTNNTQNKTNNTQNKNNTNNNKTVKNDTNNNSLTNLLNNLQREVLNNSNKYTNTQNITNQNINTQNTNTKNTDTQNNNNQNNNQNVVNTTQYAVSTTPVNIKYDKDGKISSASMKFGNETVSLTKKEIISYLNEKTQKDFNNKSALDISEYVLKDVLTVKYAENQAAKAGKKGSSAYQKTYNAVIKAQMIKTPSNMTGSVGEIVEKNNSLYVNDGSKLVKLGISADTYLNLFPPIQRFDINQGSIADCYFISGSLIDMMKNPTAFSQLVQLFSEDNKGNISVKFAGDLKEYSPVTFKNGELKEIDGLVNNSYVKKYNPLTGALGLQMLEQAYAISRFAKDSNSNISKIDIDEAIPTIEYGHQSYAYSDILNIKSACETIFYKETVDANKDLINKVQDDLITYYENYQEWLNVKTKATQLSYASENSISLLTRGLSSTIVSRYKLGTEEADIAGFREGMSKNWANQAGYNDLNNLSDEQLKEITDIVVNNNFYDIYVNKLKPSKVNINSSIISLYIKNSALYSDIKNNYYIEFSDTEATDIATLNSKLQTLKNEGLYNLAVKDSFNLDKMADDINNHKILFSIGTNYNSNEDYDIHSRHAYSIEKIDTQKKIVYVNNPWSGGARIAVPYDVFIKCFPTGSFGYLK